MAGPSRLTPAAAGIRELVQDRLPEGRFVVALSGGADSAIVAWAVASVAGDDAVRAVHVHHGLPASNDLSDAAEAVAAKLRLPFVRVDVEVPAGPSFEGRAREVRLAALEDAARPGEWIVTGHHAGDAAETVLGNLLRGAGAEGLSGITARRGRWVRPLLAADAATVRAAADELQLPYLDDPENADDRYRRNVLRREVMPWLAQKLDVPLVAILGRTAAALAADDAALESRAAYVPIGASVGAVTLPAAVLATVPEAVAARAVRAALRRAHPPYPGNAADVAAMMRLARGEGAQESLSGGFRAAREGALVAVYDREPVPGPPLRLRPNAAVNFGSWKVAATDAAPHAVPSLGRAKELVPTSLLSDDAYVRGAEEGERIDIGSGSKPVRDAMAEGGVPLRLRSAWPVLSVGGKIAWVAGVRIAEWARIGASPEPAQELSIEGTGV